MRTPRGLAARLWGLSHVLRDDGITYHQYVTELTFLLFLKMMKETGGEGLLPAGYRWADLAGKEGSAQLELYRDLLTRLGEGPGRVVRVGRRPAGVAAPQSGSRIRRSDRIGLAR